MLPHGELVHSVVWFVGQHARRSAVGLQLVEVLLLCARVVGAAAAGSAVPRERRSGVL